MATIIGCLASFVACTYIPMEILIGKENIIKLTI